MEKQPQDAPVSLGGDIGNSQAKSMKVGSFGEEDVIPSVLQVPTTASYGNRVKRAKYRIAANIGSAIFEYKGTGYIVGKEAETGGEVIRATGTSRYQTGIFDVLILAKLLRHFPNGHDNITLAIAHPPNAIPYLDTMLDLCGGARKVTRIDGQKVKFVVREVIPFDEPNGGIARFMALPGQVHNPHKLIGGQRLLVVDIGGAVSSLATVLLDNHPTAGFSMIPLYGENAQRSIELGIQHVYAWLQEELYGLYPDQFRHIRPIPANMLDEALLTNKVTLKNVAFDVTQAVLNATSTILDRIELLYNSVFGGGANYHHIIVTGGGGGLLFKALADKTLDEETGEQIGILKHQFVHAADPDVKSIHLANLRGGVDLFAAFLANRKPKAKR